MTLAILAFLIGVVAGLRSMTPLAAVAWAGWSGHIPLANTWAAFVDSVWTPAIATVLAIAELVSDQLPKTPSRKTTGPFATRVVVGAISGAALGTPSGAWIVGGVAGAIGGVVGTLGGAAARAWLAGAFGRDQPAAFLEDAVAIVAAALIVVAA